jgi:hypothetical protein
MDHFLFALAAQYSNQSVHAKNLEKPYNDSSSGSFYSSQGAPESRKVEIPNIKVYTYNDSVANVSHQMINY